MYVSFQCPHFTPVPRRFPERNSTSRTVSRMPCYPDLLTPRLTKSSNLLTMGLVWIGCDYYLIKRPLISVYFRSSLKMEEEWKLARYWLRSITR